MPSQDPPLDPRDDYDPEFTYANDGSDGHDDSHGDRAGKSGGGWLLPWLMVIGVVALLFLARGGETETDTSAPEVTRDVAFELQAKFAVGLASLQEQISSFVDQPVSLPEEQVAQFRGQGSVAQRCSSIVLLSELAGVETARDELRALEAVIKEQPRDSWTMTERDASLVALMQRVYGSGDPADNVEQLEEDDRQLLTDRLGWLGQLALVPEGTSAIQRTEVLSQATRTAVVFGVIFLSIVVFAFFGVVALFALMALSSAGRTQRHFRPARMSAARSIQIFAVWMVVFVGFQLLAGLVASATSIPAPYLNLIAFFGSGVALLWPILRGETWSDVRSDLGLHFGRNVVVEGVAGGWGFCMMLPFMITGVVGTVILATFVAQFQEAAGGLDPIETASHPIIPDAMNATTPERVALVLMAVVGAPIIEEIFFRGALYRHLRSVTAAGGVVFSVGFSALSGSILFAAIHPQGLVAIPALTGIACGITVLREWRDTIIPGMIVHGLWNGLLFATLSQLL